MPIFVAGLFQVRRAAVVAFAAMLAALAISAGVREYRAKQARQLADDIAALRAANAYGLEAHHVADAADERWKAFCYRERESLIAEAHAAAH